MLWNQELGEPDRQMGGQIDVIRAFHVSWKVLLIYSTINVLFIQTIIKVRCLLWRYLVLVHHHIPHRRQRWGQCCSCRPLASFHIRCGGWIHHLHIPLRILSDSPPDKRNGHSRIGHHTCSEHSGKGLKIIRMVSFQMIMDFTKIK